MLMGLLLGTMACSAKFFGTSQPVMMLCWRRGRLAWWRGGDVLQVQDVMVVVISSLIIVPYSIIMFLFRGGTCDSNVRTKTELVTVELEIGQLSLARSFVHSFVHHSCVCAVAVDPNTYLMCPSYGKLVGWLFWFLWCGGCSLPTLAYGLHFDIKAGRRAVMHSWLMPVVCLFCVWLPEQPRSRYGPIQIRHHHRCE